jgi:hypothetical protein
MYGSRGRRQDLGGPVVSLPVLAENWHDFHLTTAATNALSTLLKQWPVERAFVARQWSNEVDAEAATLWAGWAEPHLAAELGDTSTGGRAARL